jgi:predicted nucleic acid-binding protein
VTEFVDANIFVRFLTGDDLAKAARCHELFERARRGEVSLFTSESVIAEITYVLSSPRTYGFSRASVAVALRPLIADPGIQIDHKETVLRAIALWGDSNFDLADCLSVEHVRRTGCDGIYSYDRDFDRVAGVRRLEP